MNRNKGIKKIIWVLTVILILGCTVMPSSFADDASDLKAIQAERDALNKKYTDGKSKSSALSAELKSLEKQMYSSEMEIAALETEINDTKLAIIEAIDDLDKKKEEVGEQNKSLNERLRTMYKNGEVGMLSVLLGSSSMSDFLTNIEIIERIYDADAKLLLQLQVQYDEIEKEKNRLVELKQKLEDQQIAVEAKKAALAETKVNVANKKAVIDSDNEILSEQIDALNKEADALVAQILRSQGSDAYIGGSMCWPSQASTYISSPFGNRKHPILKVYKMHTGIDIAAAGGTNILAANAGVVISAGWNNGYGYMVMIDHGGGIVTLYAHSSKLLVSKGDVVARGQTIALVGTTGMSTGNHLHFEVRVNGAYQNPLNYVSTSVRK